jgi:hypothetical protein
MAQTFVLIAQQPLEFKGQHYEPGDRFVADGYEAAPLQVRRQTIVAPSDEQRAHGAHAQPRKRGRPRKVVTETESL